MTTKIRRPEITMSRLYKRLKAGEPAQAILGDFVEAIVATDIPTTAPSQCIQYLADQGAKVATDQRGCALEILICKPSRPRPGLYLDIAHRLAGKPGELPFHVLARHGALEISDIMLSNPDFQASLRARDTQGRTVSHWLWDGCNHMVSAATKIADLRANNANERDVDRAHDFWAVSLRHAWVAQITLQELGVGMETPDNNGITALDLCVQRINEKSAALIPGLPLCDMVAAYQRQLAMHAKTPDPIARPAHPPIPRF